MHPHDFVSQAKFLKCSKENLGDGQVVIMADFAEKHSFVLQDTVQGFH